MVVEIRKMLTVIY